MQATDQNGAEAGFLAIRLVILAYLTGMVAGLVHWPAETGLTGLLVPGLVASALAKILVVLLAGFTLGGPWRREAALLLAHVLFWSSYLVMLNSGAGTGFWRDLAVIGALLLATPAPALRPEAPRPGVVGRVEHVSTRRGRPALRRRPAPEPAVPPLLWQSRRSRLILVEPLTESARAAS